MPPLAAIERFFERLFERPSARLFRTRLQPVQLQRRIERAMESERLATSDRTLVPNRFIVRLHPGDLDGFGAMEGTLAAELADAALLFARAHRYTLIDRPRVDLVADASVMRADIRVDARFADPIGGRAAQVVETENGEAPLAGIDGSSTMVFTVPRATAPDARLHITDANGETWTTAVGAGVTVGRATDNDVVLRDERVSRHHGKVTARRGTLLYADLGSTNGTDVNGVRVTEVVLGAGDIIRVGSCVLEVEVDGSGT